MADYAGGDVTVGDVMLCDSNVVGGDFELGDIMP